MSRSYDVIRVLLPIKANMINSLVNNLDFFYFLAFLGVTGLVTTDNKNARNIDVNLWAMTNQETGEYGVSYTLIQLVFEIILLTVQKRN